MDSAQFIESPLKVLPIESLEKVDANLISVDKKADYLPCVNLSETQLLILDNLPHLDKL